MIRNPIRSPLSSAIRSVFEPSRGGVAPVPDELPERINHVLLYGQSLAFGTGGNPALTTTQKYDALMFTGGIAAASASANMAAFVPLVEATYERGAAAIAELPVDLLASEDGLAYGTHGVRFMLSDPAVGNTSVIALSPMQTGFNYLKSELSNANTNADALPAEYALAACVWRQGERDQHPTTFPENATTPSPVYKRRLRALFQMIENDAYRLNPVSAVPMVFVVYQLSSHKNSGVGGASGTDPTIAWALLDLAMDPDLPIFMSNPTYYLPHADGVHLTNQSYRQLGAAEGVTIKRLLVDRRELMPLAPASVSVAGAEITLTYPMDTGRSLVLDTTIVSDPGDYGFELYDSGNTLLGIASVAIVGTNQVRVTADASVPAGATLYYVRSGGANSGPTEGPRGCLRDDQGDTITVTVSGTPRPVHRWAAIWKGAL